MENRIRQKISEIEREKDAAGSEVYRYEGMIGQLSAEREECYSRIAADYLSEIDAAEIRQNLGGVQRKVEEIFRRKQERRSELEGLIQRNDETKQSLLERLENVTGQLNRKAEERDSLARMVSGVLKEDETYSGIMNEAEEKEKTLAENLAAYEEFRKGAETKIAAFENNRLFMYLLSRKYGTADYSAGWLTEALDGWVAKKISYSGQRDNYAYLKTMPEPIGAEIEKRQQELQHLKSGFAKRESEIAQKYGLPKVIAEGRELGKQREQVLENIAMADSTRESYNNEIRGMDSTKDKYQKEAVAELKKYLKGESIAELKRNARATPGSEDDNLVARIEEIDTLVRQYKDTAKEAQEKRDSAEEKIRGTNGILAKFRRSDYDSGRSYFNDFGIDDFIIGYILGNYSERDLWRQIDDNQHFRQPEPVYSSPISSPSDNDGGIGGGMFSSGGGSGGGGFSSGGGF